MRIDMMQRNIRETVAALCPMRAMVSTSSSVMSATETDALRYEQCSEQEMFNFIDATFLGRKIRSVRKNLILQIVD